jgi:hypothetical protein
LNRNSSEDLSNVINWSHIDGLFDVILTIGKQTMIEIDEKVGFSNHKFMRNLIF